MFNYMARVDVLSLGNSMPQFLFFVTGAAMLGILICINRIVLVFSWTKYRGEGMGLEAISATELLHGTILCLSVMDPFHWVILTLYSALSIASFLHTVVKPDLHVDFSEQYPKWCAP